MHIGPPKTATTFLQNEVLSEIRSADYLTKPHVPVGGEDVRIGSLFCFDPQVWGKTESGAFRGFLKRVRSSNESDLIISDEGIYGGVASPQPWIPDSAEWKHGPFVRLQRQTLDIPNLSSLQLHLAKLSELAQDLGFEETKILFTTRRQDTRLASGYAQLSNRVRGASQESFRKWARHLTHDSLGYHAGGGKKLDYFEYWNGISDVVGRENVSVIPFELLKEDSHEFLDRWLGYLDVTEKGQVLGSLLGSRQQSNERSVSKKTWTLRSPIRRGTLPAGRMFTALGLPWRFPLRWPDLEREETITLSEVFSKEILDTYRSANQSLDESLPHLNLKDYGYY